MELYGNCNKKKQQKKSMPLIIKKSYTKYIFKTQILQII